MPTRTRQRGFTIVELIVTLSMLGLMLFLINSLFNDTSIAVTTSVQTSKTIAQSRSINEQFTNDADVMIGPSLLNDGGYIVIIQQFLPDMTMLDPQNLSEVEVAGLRSDQIVFIRNAVGLRSMTPSDSDSYRSNLIGQGGGARAKVWYGHPLRTEPDGQTRSGTNVGLGGDRAKLDRIGSDFILGRQAMLFNPPGLDLINGTYADTAYANADVVGTTFDPVGQRLTYMGLTDVTSQSYSGLVTQLTNNAPNAPGSANDIQDYLRTSYVFDRLHVNTAPDPASPTDTPPGTGYESWAIAQTHAILAQSCSEIIIDFAADLNGDGRIDTAPGGQGPANAPIFWYDALRQAGAFLWSPDLNNDITQPFVVNSPNLKAFVFRVDDATPFDNSTGAAPIQNHSNWPYLIRIRYRLHDTRGRLTGNYNEPFVDNDGDGNVDEVNDDKISGRWFERIIRVPRP